MNLRVFSKMSNKDFVSVTNSDKQKRKEKERKKKERHEEERRKESTLDQFGLGLES